MKITLAVLLPPVAVFLTGRMGSFFLNLVCCLFCWVPGIIHAIAVVLDFQSQQRMLEHEKRMRLLQVSLSSDHERREQAGRLFDKANASESPPPLPPSAPSAWRLGRFAKEPLDINLLISSS